MNELKLVSKSGHGLKPLVEAALANELRLVEAGIRQTERRLEAFEKKYKLNTNDFLTRYENDGIEETMDVIEWIGESRMLERLNEKADTLRNIRIAS
jgi:hypothetical protein